MNGARTGTLAHLRGSIARIEAPSRGGDAEPRRARSCRCGRDAARRPCAGCAARGVRRPAIRAGAATGFIAGLAGRISARKPLVWVRQDFSDRENGALSMSGLCRARPRSAPPLVTVRAADVDGALRTAADALACDALGAVVLEVWGEARQLDLVASRKLTLAVAGLPASPRWCCGSRRAPIPSTAETRWIVRAAHSPPGNAASVWGAPRFEAELVRNRHGPVGRWIMEWKCDECQFSEPSAYPQPVAATPAHRPHQAQARAGHRLAG